MIPAQCEELYWLVQVESLSDVLNPNKDHAYILPDDTVWVLSYDENHFVQLSGTGEEGLEILMRVSDGYIQWKHVKDIEWNNLISLDEITEEQRILIKQLQESIADMNADIENLKPLTDLSKSCTNGWISGQIFSTEDGSAPPGWNNTANCSGCICELPVFTRFTRVGRVVFVDLSLGTAGVEVTNPITNPSYWAWSAILDQKYVPMASNNAGNAGTSTSICWKQSATDTEVVFKLNVSLQVSSATNRHAILSMSQENPGNLSNNTQLPSMVMQFGGKIGSFSYLARYDENGNEYDDIETIPAVVV